MNLGRRQALTGLAAGVAALPLLRCGTGPGVDDNARLIRPPGSLEETDFLARCIRCGECMKSFWAFHDDPCLAVALSSC